MKRVYINTPQSKSRRARSAYTAAEKPDANSQSLNRARSPHGRTVIATYARLHAQEL